MLRSLARRIQAATVEAAELEREILTHVRALAPQLLDEPGVGPIVAAQLLVAWSHHDRVRSEAAFARLAGVAPVPASSGKTTRHRLSRGGDRQLNRALHTIALHRRQHDAATRDYIARRVADGKTRRDATRMLKRYLARHLRTSSRRRSGSSCSPCGGRGEVEAAERKRLNSEEIAGELARRLPAQKLIYLAIVKAPCRRGREREAGRQHSRSRPTSATGYPSEPPTQELGHPQ